MCEQASPSSSLTPEGHLGAQPRSSPGPDGSEDFMGPALWPAVQPFAAPAPGIQHSVTSRHPVSSGLWNLAAFLLISASVPPATPVGLHQALFAFNY